MSRSRRPSRKIRLTGPRRHRCERHHANGDFVGIVFDGNIETLTWDYLYSDKQARSVAVDSRA
jgi:hypothetical protein